MITLQMVFAQCSEWISYVNLGLSMDDWSVNAELFSLARFRADGDLNPSGALKI